MLDALLFTKTPGLLKSIYPDCLWKIDTNENKIYLTFDDGPIPDITPFVLSELKKWNAKATFFCIGKNIQSHTEIYRQIIAEGHRTGNHTYDHLNGWNVSDAQFYENIEQCQSLLDSLGSTSNTKLFRPPYGKLKPAQYKYLKRKYQIVMWDVLTFDFDLKISAQKVLENAIKNTESGSIIVMHDSLKAMHKVTFSLPKFLEFFTAKGFTFERIE